MIFSQKSLSTVVFSIVGGQYFVWKTQKMNIQTQLSVFDAFKRDEPFRWTFWMTWRFGERLDYAVLQNGSDEFFLSQGVRKIPPVEA